MNRSARFPSAVHILTMLAAGEGKYMSSHLIAKSLDTNRVVVLRLIGMLTKAGLVLSQTGTRGGAKLAKRPKDISLLNIYHAVERGSVFRIHQPRADCPVGACVTTELAEILNEAEAALEKKLSSQSLAQSMKNGIHEMKRFAENQRN